MQNRTYKSLKPQEIDEVSKALTNGEYPENSTLSFNICSGEGIKDAGIKKIAQALQSGKCPRGLSLCFSNNGITDVGAKDLADAIQHPNCPPNLRINFDGNPITKTGGVYIANAVKNSRALGLQLEFGEYLGVETLLAFVDALKTNTTILEVSRLSANAHHIHYLAMINLCCVRNRLLMQYPELQFFIKQISYEHGFYATNPGSGPLPLKFTAAVVSIYANQHAKANIPQEIRDYIDALLEIDKLSQQMHRYRPGQS